MYLFHSVMESTMCNQATVALITLSRCCFIFPPLFFFCVPVHSQPHPFTLTTPFLHPKLLLPHFHCLQQTIHIVGVSEWFSYFLIHGWFLISLSGSRSFGSNTSNFRMKSCAGGVTCIGNRRSMLRIRLYVASRSLATNGGSPHKNSYVSTPMHQLSTLESYSLRSIISGGR